MTFSEFSTFLARLESTSSRIEITKILSELIVDLSSKEIRYASYLLIGSLGPSYDRAIFNIAGRMMERAIASAYDLSPEKVTVARKRLGDLGNTASELSDVKVNSSKTLSEVYEELLLIAKESGEGSQSARIEIISNLLKSLEPQSAKYATRIILGNLRLGFSEKTIIDALSWAYFGDKSKSSAILRAYEVVPDIGALAEKIKEVGIEKLEDKVDPVVGIPVQPMLAQRLKSPRDMIKKMGEVAVEPKFDGLRVLIHASQKRNVLKAFTRNLKDISGMFPELSDIFKYVKASEFILDTEAVGMDSEFLHFLDFQTTMKRKRKHEIAESQSKIPLTFQVFDILSVDGRNLMSETYLARRKVLSQVVKNGSLLRVDDYTVTNVPEEITKLHKEFRAKGLEGVVVKKTDSSYVPGRLGWRWVKMKEEEAAAGKLSDTIDGIILGFTSGQGKRVDFGIGQFLVGVKSGDEIVTLTKVGTGLTDEQFRELNIRLQKIKVKDKPGQYNVHRDLTPDFWVKPEVVVELAGDDLTVSPKHTAGYALRFPRLVKFRDDKSPEQATTTKEVEKLFKLQKK